MTTDDERIETEHKGIPIRSVSRAIAVLQALNRLGSANLMTIARAAKVPYPTASRLVETLIHEGLIERERGRKHYRPTALVQTLSYGFQGQNRLLVGARPHMEAVTQELLWPVSLATRIGTSMIVRDSTHGLTSLTFSNYHPGFALPILGCASGLVYLAFASAEERQTILDGLKLIGQLDAETALMFENDYLPKKIRADKYAQLTRNPHTLNPGKTSSIAVPLSDHGILVGALTLIFFASSMSPGEAVRKYLQPLLETAAAIERDWASAPS